MTVAGAGSGDARTEQRITRECALAEPSRRISDLCPATPPPGRNEEPRGSLASRTGPLHAAESTCSADVSIDFSNAVSSGGSMWGCFARVCGASSIRPVSDLVVTVDPTFTAEPLLVLCPSAR